MRYKTRYMRIWTMLLALMLWLSPVLQAAGMHARGDARPMQLSSGQAHENCGTAVAACIDEQCDQCGGGCGQNLPSALFSGMATIPSLRSSSPMADTRAAMTLYPPHFLKPPQSLALKPPRPGPRVAVPV